MIKRRQRGFTIVELLIVIIVISILAMITTILYTSAQKQARDLKNIDAANKVADGIQLFVAKYQHFPVGGSGSTIPIGAGTECVNGMDGYIGVGIAGFACTVGDTLVASGYLPSGFVANLSPNTKQTYTDGRAAIMVYKIDSTRAMVMTSMEDPTAQDSTNFDAALTKCSVASPANYAPRKNLGMRYGICVTFSTP